jgi:hypothetical protein
MKGRPRPIHHPAYKAVFERVGVDVVSMHREILLIANPVLPKAALPDATLRLGLPTL